jgi:hypothetical protein
MILPSSINPLEADKLKEQFNLNKKVVIKDFLKEETANFLFDFLSGRESAVYWYTAVLAGNDATGYEAEPNYFSHTDSIEDIETNEFAAVQSFGRGFFSYSFDKTGEHPKSCTCEICNFTNLIQSSEIFGKIAEIFNAELKKSVFYATRFKQVQFFAPHEINSGKIGFRYELTKNWKPEWGGNTFFTEEDKIKEIITPSFNTLTLYDISSYNSKFVSQVAAGVTDGVYSIEGYIK